MVDLITEVALMTHLRHWPDEILQRSSPLHRGVLILLVGSGGRLSI
jgi:hypothetical protein